MQETPKSISLIGSACYPLKVARNHLTHLSRSVINHLLKSLIQKRAEASRSIENNANKDNSVFLRSMIKNAVKKIKLKIKFFVTSAVFRCVASGTTVDNWHFLHNYHSREYMRKAVGLANTISIRSVVEIGCGFGEVLSRVNAKNKVGIDKDKNIIKIARKYYGSKISFIQVSEGRPVKIDCCLLICLNWCHEVETSEFNLYLSSKNLRFRYILMDLVMAGTPNYPYYHKVEDFPNFELVTLISGGLNEPRNIVLMRNKRYEG